MNDKKTTETNHFNTNLKVLRKLYNHTQAEIADLLYISRSTYASYESSNLLPNCKIGLELARFYNIPFEDLFFKDLKQFFTEQL